MANVNPLIPWFQKRWSDTHKQRLQEMADFYFSKTTETTLTVNLKDGATVVFTKPANT